MAKRYIQNCTGQEGEKKSTSGGKSHASLMISKLIFYVLLIGFLSVSIYVLFFSSYLKILNVEISGTNELSQSDVRQKIEKLLQEKYLGVIPKDNFLFISQNGMSNVLKGDFKKIRAVTITKKFPDSIGINIDERRALMVWCSREKCYLLDENGTAFSEADFNSQELIQNNLLRITDLSGRAISIGENVIESSYEKYALEIGKALGGIGIETNGEYSTPSHMAEEIRVKTTSGMELYFSIQFSLESAINSLRVVLAREIPEVKRGDVEYVDLRNENKVFYKFKNIEPEVETPEVVVESVKKEQ